MASAIPMTRLGERSLNHNSSSNAEAEYDRLRDLARKEASQRNSCFDRVGYLFSFCRIA